MKRAFLVVLALAWASPASAAVTASPMKTSGGAMPRLAAFPDAKIRARVNALLAGQERQDRAAERDCKQQVADAHLDASFYDYQEEAEVVWLSQRFMSVRIGASWNCGGAHPDAQTSALNIDLAAGAPLAWERIFKPGYEDALRKLYQVHYRNADPECRDAVKDDLPGGMVLWLDRKKGGLTVEPEFAHAIQACGDEMTFGPAELAPLVADENFLAELKGR